MEGSLAASAPFCDGVEPRNGQKVPSKHFADNSREQAGEGTHLSGFIGSLGLSSSRSGRFQLVIVTSLFLPP